MTSEFGAGGAFPKPSHRRRQVVVNRGFQFKYAFIMFVLFGLAAFMVWWEIYNSFRSLIGQGLIQDPAAVRMVSDMGRIVLYKVMIALAIVWFLSLLLSHYLAGPIYRIQACLKLLKEGDLVHRARFRPHDELKSLAANYNEAVDALHVRIKAINEAAARGSVDKIKQITEEFKV